VLCPPKFIKELNVSTSSSTTCDQVEHEKKTINKITLNEKSHLKIDCNVIGFPKPIIKWFHNNDEIISCEKMKIDSKNDNYSLTIKDCTNIEKGVYKISAENNVGSTFSQLILELNNMPSFIKCLSNNEIKYEENLNFEFNCIYTSQPKAEALWYFGEKCIQPDETNHYFIISENKNDENGNEISLTTLKLQNLNLEDSGTYTCRLKNCAGEISSHAVLTILVPPSIIQHLPPNLSIIEKKELRFQCHISESIPKSDIHWFKNGNSLKNSKKISIEKPIFIKESNMSIYTIVIFETTSDDSGIYMVSATNKIANIESSCFLNVLSSPKIIKDIKSTIECNEFDRVSLELGAIGKPLPEIGLYRFIEDNNSYKEILLEEGNINSFKKLENTYVLEFLNVIKTMEGKYIIKLSNEAGTIETSFLLIVNGI
jgi:hypothetical protein